MSKILAIGDIYLETQFFVDAIPGENNFAFSEQMSGTVGSKVINAARVLHKLGSEVTYAGKVGSDAASSGAVEALRGYGLTPNVSTVEDESVGRIVVITPLSGNSAITLFKGANAFFTSKDVDELFTQQLENFDAVYTSTSLNLDALYRVIEKVTALEKPLFLDTPNQHQVLEKQRLRNVAFVMPNRQEAELLSGTTIRSLVDAQAAATQLRAFTAGTIIITLDQDGCVVLTPDTDQPVHIATAPVTAVDTTAAGDIFRAVFAHTYLQTLDIEQAVSLALSKATASTLVKGVDASIMAVEL